MAKDTPDEKVPNTEYKAAGTTLKVGDTAAKTLYLDADGKVTATAPERGKVLVAEGDIVTQTIVNKAQG